MISQNGVSNNSILVYNSSDFKPEATQALTNVQSALGPLNTSLKSYGGGSTGGEFGTGITQNSTFTIQTYVDNTDCTMFNQYTTTSTSTPISAYISSSNYSGRLSVSSNELNNSTNFSGSGFNPSGRINIDFGTANTFLTFYYDINGTGGTGSFYVYYSTSSTSYSVIDPTTDPSLYLALTIQNGGSRIATVISPDTTNSYRYKHLIDTVLNSS